MISQQWTSILTVMVACSHWVTAIPLSDFYPFGSSTSDSSLPASDDGSSGPIPLTLPFPFFDEDLDEVIVYNNGIIVGVSQLPPDPLSGFLQLIAPFRGDVDTRGTGLVWYRDTTDPVLLVRAADDLQMAFIYLETFLPTFLFIATWDHVGYYSAATDRTNTFQCVMATDGVNSFVMLLYADGEIQWTTGDASGGTGGLGGTPAQVGFQTGDGMWFAVPGSRTREIINVTQTSNVGVPGVWIFKVGEDITMEECSTRSESDEAATEITLVSVTIAPRAGNVLGGTAVQVAGPCLEETDNITCVFDGQEVGGVFINTLIAVCVSPPLSRLGNVPFQLIVRSTSGDVRTKGTGEFFSLAYDDGDRIGYNTDNVLFQPGDTVDLTWSPKSVMPALDPSFFLVNIGLCCFNDDTGEWDLVADLATELPNSGSAQVTIPPSPSLVHVVCPISIQITAVEPVARCQNADSVLSSILRLRPSIWGPIGVLACSRSLVLNDLCDLWYTQQLDGIGATLSAQVQPCPPTEAQARADNRFEREKQVVSGTFHPDTSMPASCFRQVVLNRRGEECQPGSQCCYGWNGNLLQGAGTIDSASPQGTLACYNAHFFEDVIPSIFCCFSLFPNCNRYYQKRPARNSDGYVFPVSGDVA